MKQIFLIISLFLISDLGFSTEKEIPSTAPLSEIAPNIDYRHQANADSMWQLQFCYNGQFICNDTQLLGVEFDGEYFWLTGANSTTNPNHLYKVNTNGTLVATFNTNTVSAWGWRDLAWGGTYLYASEDASGGSCIIDVIDPLAVNPGIPVDSIVVTGVGTNFARALAYDPVSCHFYSGNFGLGIMEIDTLGNIIRTVNPPAILNAIYGFAWDDDAPDGPWLWVHNQSGIPANTLYRLDPVTLQNVTYSYNYGILPPNTAGMAGGLAYTDELVPDYSTMIVLIQGTPYDQFAGFEMYPIIPPNAPGVVTNFDVQHNYVRLLTTLQWVNPLIQFSGQPLTQLSGIRIFRQNAQIADLTNVQIGQEMSYMDTVAVAGWYNYKVQPYNDAGNGAPSDTSLWIGLDVPAAPDDFMVEPDSNGFLTTYLSWSAPTSGAHNGYFRPGAINGYNIYRAPAGGAFSLIASVNTLRFVDNFIPVQGWYTYAVAGYNRSGEGEQAINPAQYVGPLSYEPIPYNWIEIANVGTNTGITGDDQNLGPFPIGFFFPWYGQVFNSIRVCSNGWASFTSTATAYTNASIPNPAEPNNIIAPFWDDLTAIGGGGIWYQTLTNPTCFILEWNHINQYGTTNTPRTFEMILYPNGNIDFMYNDFVGGTVLSSTIGIENSSGTVGIQCTYNGSGPFNPAPQTGLRIYFIAPLEQTVVKDTFYLLPFTFNFSAYPNPFNSSVALRFEMPDASPYDLVIHDIKGREVWRLATRNSQLGTNEVVWEAEGMPSGIYFARLSVLGHRSSVFGGQSSVQKLLLLK